nr:exopolysaccharide production protein PSS, putative [Tanacetum cinerariifolium]
MILYARRTYVNQILLLVLDVLVIFGVFRLIDYIQRGDWQFEGNYPLFFAIFALLWWVLAGHFASAVPLDRLTSYWEKFWGLVRTFLLHTIFLTIGMIVLQVHLMPMRYLALLYCAVATVVISGRLFLAFLYRTYRYRLAQPHSRFVIVGASRSGYDLHRFLTMHDPLANQCLGFFAEGPVFFKQLRPGKRNQLFPCYKLRTMRTDLSGLELQATKDDARVTRFGRFLRSSSLDELPQFFNVWMGHMSVVGPRPNMVSQLEEYSKHISTYAQRHAVTPGITGYAQVNGYRGETRAEGAMEKRVEYDLKYVENWSARYSIMLAKQVVLDSDISTGSFDEFVDYILQLGAARTSAYVCCANVHMVVEAHRDASFRQILEEANLVTPDGGPVASVAGWMGGHPQERVAGMDLVPALLAEAAERGQSVYFYGTTDDVLQAIVERAHRELPHLRLYGRVACGWSGPIGCGWSLAGYGNDT